MDRRNQTPYWRDEGDEAGAQRFQERHQTFSDKVERFLMQLVILGLVGLVLVQTFQVMPTVRRLTNLVEALEGTPWNEALAWRGDDEGEGTGAVAWQAASGGPAVAPVSGTSRSLTLTVDLVSHRSAPDARLLLDGQPAGTFADGRISLQVKPGQVVVIDGGELAEARIFRVIEASGLASPPLGAQVSTRGDQQRLGVVRPAQ